VPSSESESGAKTGRATTGGRLLSAAWSEILQEPTKLAGVAYLWFVAVGFAHLFGSGMAFDLNVIDLASPSDFLVSGLRNPFVIVLAAVTGWGLYTMWERARTNSRYRSALLPTAVALLIVGAICSGFYRHSVVRGYLQCIGPKNMEVEYDGGSLKDFRLAVATADFLVFANDDQTVILSRASIKSMSLGE
jgi:hypothetical protein